MDNPETKATLRTKDKGQKKQRTQRQDEKQKMCNTDT
jgi:hypothetical protein